MGLPIALRAIEGNVVTDRAGRRTAYYLLAPVRFSYRPEAECDAMLVQSAARLAALVGRRVHLRITSRPYPVETWARVLDHASPDALPAWPQFLRSEQRHVLGLTLADKQAFYGVELTRRAPRPRASGWSGRLLPRRAGTRDADAAELDRIMAGAGLDASPAAPEDLEWLLHRSASLGMPAPVTLPPPRASWEAEDLPEVTDAVTWTAEPYGRSVRITAEVSGHQYVRHVVVLSLGRMSELDIPARTDPWTQLTDRLPFPVEWSGRFTVLHPQAVRRETSDASKRVMSQVEHYQEHRLDPPMALERQRRLALRVDDEVTADFTGLATRVEGWFRVAVSGGSEEEALERAAQLADLYAPAITMVRGFDQYRVAREFIPGEPLANTAYKRRMPVLTVAAAVPSATAVVGDREGVHLGHTAGSSVRAVMWEPWRKTEEREGSGLVIVAGGLGAGKSTLVGLVTYKNVLRGIPFTLLDPAGRLGAICELPEVRDVSLSVNLMNSAPGTLNPYRVVAEPRPEDHDSAGEYARQRSLAAAQRRTLTADILSMLLPAQILDLPATRITLSKAIRHVGGEPTRSPRQVIDALRSGDLMGSYAEHAATIAELLDEVAEMPQTALFFPGGSGAHDVYRGDAAPLLTVLSTPGLVLPDEDKPRDDWSTEERLGLPILHLASWLTSRSIYERSPHQRKGLGLDETHYLSSIPSGRALISTVSRNSRKWNLVALMASQNVADVTTAGIGNFIGAVFAGRTEDPRAQADALDAFRIPHGVGYEEVLGGLSPHARTQRGRSGVREFVFADGAGGIEKIRVDLTGTPSLAAALDTTADPSKLRAAPAAAAGDGAGRPGAGAPVPAPVGPSAREPLEEPA